MEEMYNYFNFVKKNGRPLSEINPGSDELGLKINDALKAIELLRSEKTAILGGDVLSDEMGSLVYTYENWYCNKKSDEDQSSYINRSCDFAKKYISNIETRDKSNYYIVIVV